MEILIAFPILILCAILQSAVISRLVLLNGYADLVLVVIIAWSLQEKVKYGWFWGLLAGIIISIISATPIPVILVGYMFAILLAKTLQNRIWQAPVLSMMLVTLIGTGTLLGVEILILELSGINLALIQSLTRVVLPSILLNLLLAAPVYILMRDLANLIYPKIGE